MKQVSYIRKVHSKKRGSKSNGLRRTMPNGMSIKRNTEFEPIKEEESFHA
jgi:hypothetical protein